MLTPASRGISTGYELQATGRSQNPHPDPPPREGDFVGCGTAGRGPCVGCKLQSTSHGTRLRATDHEPQLQATSYRPHAAFPDFPGRGRTRRPRAGAHAARTAKTLSPPSCRPRVAHCGPSRRLRRTPRTRGADTWVRPYEAPRATVFSFPQPMQHLHADPWIGPGPQLSLG